MQVLEISNTEELKRVMQDIKVDSWGIKIMSPKALTHLLRINSLSNIAANILKQEMLSLGADAAVARDALTGRTRKTDCLLMGNMAQFGRLAEKLNRQPFGLAQFGQDLSSTLNNYQKNNFVFKAGKYKLNLGRRAHIMGILNMTPDSFSGDGFSQVSSAVDFAGQMVSDGADIIDVGGQSSRPGARPVSTKEEINRSVPIIKELAKKIKAPISVDTYKPQVAKAALDNGASMVNDITGLRNPAMARLAAKYKAAVVVMHMQGEPRTMQRNPKYGCLITDIIEYLRSATARAEGLGIAGDKIIIDPGLGFGKTLEHNFEILKRLKEFKVLGYPIMIGASRKSFIGKILNTPPGERLYGTISACVLARENGAGILRVHDVKEVSEALKISDAVNRL